MSTHELHPEVAPRLVLYGLDEPARQRLQQLWPLIEPHVPAAIDEFCTSSRRTMVHLTAIYEKHFDRIREIQVAQFSALLRGRFDNDYAETCQRTVKQLDAVGLEARAAVFAG